MLESFLLKIAIEQVASRFAGKALGGEALSTAMTIMNALGVFGGVKIRPDALNKASLEEFTDAIVDGIKVFQQRSGATADGIPVLSTLNLLKRFLCSDPAKPTSGTKVTPRDNKTVRVFVDKLPAVSGGNAEELFWLAWENWSAECGLEVLEAQSIDRCEVVATVGRLDGSGNKLAEAHIGPPREFRLSLVFDESETFVASAAHGGGPVFGNTAAHEIGHILGLKHEDAPAGALMFGMHQPDLLTPQPHDIARILKIWPL